MEKTDVTKFFENVKEITKEIDREQRVNVLYLTTACNLRCTYCYEGDYRDGEEKAKKLSPDDIDQFLNEIRTR